MGKKRPGPLRIRVGCPRSLLLAGLLASGGPMGFSCLAADDAGNPLQRPPAKIPRDFPALSALLVDEAGAEIRTRETWAVRREALRKRLQDRLGSFPSRRAPLDARLLESEELLRFKREHIKYRIEGDVFTDGYLLTPRNAVGKLPAVVVFHTTIHSQARQPAGLDPSQPDLMLGVDLAGRGYLALCPRSPLFGEPENTAKMIGRHPDWKKGMGLQVFNAMRAVDYLESLPDVDRARIGCMGSLRGAKEALYAAAVDERFRAVVFSEGGLGKGSYDSDAHQESEDQQLLALIAPRAFLLVTGGHNDGDESWAFIEAALPVYRLLGKPAAIGWHNHHQGNRFPQEARALALDFLDRNLKD